MGKELTLDTILKYEKGELTAIAYDEMDCEIARDTKRSFGDTANIRLTPDKTELIANSDDLIFVDISAYDKAGEFVANANDRVFVQVSGAGRLIGLDNGDSTDFEQYKGTSRRLFSGKLLAVIAAKTTPGEIMLRVTSSTNLESTIQLKAVPGEDINGITAIEENIQREFDCSRGENDIPVRKIELVGEKKVFTLEQKELKFTTKIYPANSTYKEEIEYRITTALGIPSNLAEITSLESGEITVKCKGDGEFCLRALCKNGTDKYHILSAIKLSATGIGTCFVDPYHLVKGGLYSLEGGNIANGLERGIKFEGGRSWFGFENVDFGPVGSDTVTLPICTWNGVGIQVYDGIPDEGELIGDFRYDREPVIMNYVPQTFQLQKKLKGVHTLCFLATDSFDMEGFVFEKQKKEVSLLYAAECEKIYGDCFSVNEKDITGIGNNVVIEFGEFDFTDSSPSFIGITGKSLLPLNTINLVCKGEIEKRIIIEFEKAEDYTKRIFPIEEICGKCSISFTFLPGTDYDFLSFRFLR